MQQLRQWVEKRTMIEHANRGQPMPKPL